MLVRKGNAFYEIDEDCMRRKGLKLPEEQEQVLYRKEEDMEALKGQQSVHAQKCRQKKKNRKQKQP